MVEKVKKIIVEILGLDEERIKTISGDSSLIELGLDSLNAIEIIVNLESEFDIEVDDEDLMIDSLETIDLLCNLVKKYTEGKE